MQTTLRYTKLTFAAFALAQILAISLRAHAAVSPMSGIFTDSWVDTGIAGSASSLKMVRSWQPGRTIQSHIFASSWCSNWDIELRDLESQSPKLLSCDRTTVFQLAANSKDQFVSKTNPYESLQKIKSGDPAMAYIYKLGGRELYFDSTGLLQSIKDTHGNHFNLSYDNSKIKKITSTRGQSLELSYKNSCVSSISQLDKKGKPDEVMSYEFDGDLLKSVAPIDKDKLSYHYDSSGRLTEVLRDDHVIKKINYESRAGHTVSSVTERGCVFTYKFENSHSDGKNLKTTLSTSCSSQKKNEVVMQFGADSSSRSQAYLASASIQADNKTGAVHYDRKTKKISEEVNGNKRISYAYDSLTRLTKVEHVGESSFAIAYDQDSARPASIKFSKGDVSEFFTINYNQNSQVSFLKTPASDYNFLYDHNDRLFLIKKNKKNLFQAFFKNNGDVAKAQVLRGTRELELNKIFGTLNTLTMARTNEGF